MTYSYHCEPCAKTVDVIKHHSLYRSPEHCAQCGGLMTKAIAPVRVHLYNTKVSEKKFQPTIGRVATDSEMREEAKSRGWEEVGNESMSHIQPERIEYPDFSEEDIKSLTPEKLASLP